MPELAINLVKGDKAGSDSDYRDYLPINMTAIIKPLFGAAGYMYQEPGIVAHGEGVGIDRGSIWNERLVDLFRVSGDQLISVDSSGDIDIKGFIRGEGQVSLPYSFNTQGIVAGGDFFLFDGTDLKQVTDPEIGDPIDAVWVDGYYFFTDGEFIYHSDISDESSIDPLKFATSEFSPDPTLGVAKTTDNKVMVLNRYTIEYFINSANDNFAFTRVPTRALKVGIVGTHCKVEISAQWFIMGGHKDEAVSVYVVGVGSAQKISTREIDKVIALYSEQELSTAVLESRVSDNTGYLIIHLTNDVLVLNLETLKTSGPMMSWSRLSTGVNGDAWRAINGVYDPRISSFQYGDKIDGRLGLLDDLVATQYDEIAEWVLNTPFLYLDSTSIDKLEIEILPGFNDSGDATVFASMTYDGVAHGHEYTMQYGSPSDYNNRFIARRLGYIRDWVGIKLRGATRTRMAFSRAFIHHG